MKNNPEADKELGLSHYSSPFYVYAYYFKQAIYVLDGILDCLIHLPVRIYTYSISRMLCMKTTVQFIEFQVDIVHMLLLWSVVAVLNSHTYFEIGFWYHNIRGQSQFKLYGIIQIIDLIDKSLCVQGDYIMRQLYYSKVIKSGNVINRYLIYSFIYLLLHSLLLVFQLSYYTVILSSGKSQLYLALFILSLIKLKGSVFKKQDLKSSISMAQTDAREFFQKIYHVGTFLFTLKFMPDDFITKVAIYFAVDIFVDAFKYSQIVHLNNLQSDFLGDFSTELTNFSYALTLNREFVEENLADIYQKDLYQCLQLIPSKEIKIVGKLQFLVFPYAIIFLKTVIYQYRRNNIPGDILILIGLTLLADAFVKSVVGLYNRTAPHYQKIENKQKKAYGNRAHIKSTRNISTTAILLALR